MIKRLLKKIFVYEKETEQIANIDKMECKLGYIFHKCDVHRCSIYGCFDCGQLVFKQKQNNL